MCSLVLLCYSWDSPAMINCKSNPNNTHTCDPTSQTSYCNVSKHRPRSSDKIPHYNRSNICLCISRNSFQDPNFFFFHSGKPSFVLIENKKEMQIFGQKLVEVISNSILYMNSSSMQLSLTLSLSLPPQQGASVIEHTLETKTNRPVWHDFLHLFFSSLPPLHYHPPVI